MHRGAWWATVHGVTKSQTRLSNFTFTFTIQYSTAQGGSVDDLRKKAVSDEYHIFCSYKGTFQVALGIKNLPTNAGDTGDNLSSIS